MKLVLEAVAKMAKDAADYGQNKNSLFIFHQPKLPEKLQKKD